ncbi:MAG: MFS transporter [Chloroflexi bacterium]|nr:MFS transporter [Chloroflexota bacterium]
MRGNQVETEIENQAGEQVGLRPFLIIFSGQIFSLLGSALVQFALVWWLTKTTGSATVLALATMTAILPRVFISPIAGALVDRWSRRLVMIVADGVMATAVILLAVLFALDVVQVWHIYALMFIRASAEAFHWPAMQASTTLMVPEQHLSRVAGLNQTVYGLAGIIAPPLGALLLELLPMQGILAIDVATAILAIIPLLFIHIPQPKPKLVLNEAEGTAVAETSPSMWADLRAGLRYVRTVRGVLVVMGIAMIANLLIYPAIALQPLLVTDHFGGGATQLAWLESAFGGGVVAGGILLTVWGGFRRKMVTAGLAMILFGIGFGLVGAAPASLFGLAVGGMLFAGMMNSMMTGAFFAVLQQVVPAEMQGRVFTLLQSGGGVMIPLGLAVAGPLADFVGVRPWYIGSGIAIFLCGVVAFGLPSALYLEDMAVEATPASPIGESPTREETVAAPNKQMEHIG